MAQACHNGGTVLPQRWHRCDNSDGTVLPMSRHTIILTGEIADSSAETVRPAQKKRGKPRHTSLGITGQFKVVLVNQGFDLIEQSLLVARIVQKDLVCYLDHPIRLILDRVSVDKARQDIHRTITDITFKIIHPIKRFPFEHFSFADNIIEILKVRLSPYPFIFQPIQTSQIIAIDIFRKLENISIRVK